MTIVRILSTIAATCSLAGAAGAQTDACDVQAGPPSPEFELYVAKQWPQEAERFRSNGQNVSREAGRLRLTLENGSVELTDCPDCEVPPPRAVMLTPSARATASARSASAIVRGSTTPSGITATGSPTVARNVRTFDTFSAPKMPAMASNKTELVISVLGVGANGPEMESTG